MNLSFLTDTALFRGCSEEELQAMLDCLHAATHTYERGEILCHAGDEAMKMGLVLSGRVSIERYDAWGTRSILDVAGPGQVFAETYACLPGEKLMVTVVAEERCVVLLLDVRCLWKDDAPSCPHTMRLLRNLLTVSAHKNLTLSRRIFHTSSKSIRGRVMSYLSYQSLVHGSPDFEIPLNRQQLADYLSVDRSALSAEMSRMQQEGLIAYRRSRIRLLTDASSPQG